MWAVLVLAFFVTVFYIIQRLLDYRGAIRSVGNHPGYRTLLSQSCLLAKLLPSIHGVSTGRNFLFRHKFQIFQFFGWDTISAVSAWPQSEAIIILADAYAIRDVLLSRSRFPKPVQHYQVLLFFGRNIIASEGDEWKKYRKIAAPAFSERNNRLVWDETVKIMGDMFQNVWGSQAVITTEHCADLMLLVALFVIGIAGFGHKVSWEDDTDIPFGHQMTFKDALHNVSADMFLKAFVPDRVLGLTKRTRNIKLAFDELRKYMLEMIQDREVPEKEERYDIFSNLLNANNENSTKSFVLSDQMDLSGNIFLFLLAGHESTAHILCFTLALLALYQGEQDTLFQHIKSVLSDGRYPAYEDMNLLTHSAAVYNEALRMFPPVTAIPKESAEDTFLIATNNQGEAKSVPVPKGTTLVIDIVGLHYNPRYWKDPETFKPSRFLGEWCHDAFLPFSAGARACLGRRFSETEGIAVLTMLVSRYKIEVKEDPRFANETFEARRDRILACKAGLTLTPTQMPLVFKLRDAKGI
ncbi:cytochrome P450 [Collybia nuda]|uniref:Cytochrome P450 n=1 Tax=Collybia nuda TaxID=64659 RepID=A0A9P5YIC4_9AGAR|nr:cytochrome P450 [Collybia nuda]